MMTSELDGFENYLRSIGRSESTISAYVGDVKNLGGWSSNSMGLAPHELAQINLTYFKKVLKNSGKAYTTVNRIIAAINVYYHYLYDVGIITERYSIDPITIRTKRVYKGLDDKELWKLRTEIHKGCNKTHICMFGILLGTGIRVSELINIKLKDLKLTDRKGRLIILGKGEVVREIPINKEVRNILKIYLDHRISDSEYLFPSVNGKPYNRISINRILQRYSDRIGITVSPHKLRHTLGYRLVRDKREITTIQQILGHSTINTTNTYTMTTETDMEVALDEISW